MKKLMTALVMAFTLCLALTCASCGSGKTISGISIKEGTLESQYEIGSTIDESAIVIVVTYSDKSTDEIAYYADGVKNENLTITGIPTDTSTTGQHTITITYTVSEDEVYSATFTLSIVEEITAEIESVISVQRPTSISSFDNAKTSTDVYYVGNDNAFIFQPIISALVKGEDEAENLSSYISYTQVYLGDTKLTAQDSDSDGLIEFYNNGNTYVEVDNTTQEFYFTDNAIGKSFKLVVTHESLASDLEEGLTSKYSSYEVSVIDGYNVYNTYDLSVMDNANTGWNDLREDQGITIDVDSVTAVILHCDINLVKADTPTNIYYTQEELATYASSGSTDNYQYLVNNNIDGTLIDYSTIFRRNLSAGKTFTIQGNHFKVDASNMPYVTVEKTGDYGTEVGFEAGSLNGHATLFRVKGEEVENTDGDTTTYTNNCVFTVNNLTIKGNSSKEGVAEDEQDELAFTVKSGGLITFKTANVATTLNSVSVRASYIGYFPQVELFNGGTTTYHYSNQWANGASVLNNCTITDIYSSAIYSYGGGNITINDSTISNSGGPAIIAEHYYSQSSESVTDGVWTNVYVNNSTVKALLNGSEVWFTQQEGTSAIVDNLKALSAVFASASSGTKTLICDTVDTTQYINCPCIFKTQSASLNFYPSYGVYVVDGVIVLDMSGYYGAESVSTEYTYSTNVYASQGAPLFVVNTGTSSAQLLHYGIYPGTGNVLYKFDATATSTNYLGTIDADFYSTDASLIGLYYRPTASSTTFAENETGYLGAVLGYANIAS